MSWLYRGVGGRVTLASALSLSLLIAQCDPPSPAPSSTTVKPRVPVTVTYVVSSIGSIDGPASVPTRSTLVVREAPVRPATPTLPTTTTTVVAVAPPPVGSYQHPNPNVERWHQTALDAGWPESEWKRVSCIIFRESGGIPTAHNPRDPGLGSFGLMQLNLSLGSQGTWALWGPGLGWDSSRLYDPATNLRYARELYERAKRMWGAPWRPWGPGSC